MLIRVAQGTGETNLPSHHFPSLPSTNPGRQLQLCPRVRSLHTCAQWPLKYLHSLTTVKKSRNLSK